MMHFCEYCGSEVPVGAGFCGVCGRAVGKPQQMARGNGGYSASNESIPGSANNVSVPDYQRRSTRRPYQYSPQSPQQYQSQQWAEEPAIKYSQTTPEVSP